MIGLETVTLLLSKHGLALLAPIAVIEGPIVTVIAAWLANRGMFDIWSVSVVVIIADAVGDVALYAIGRWGMGKLPGRWLTRLGLNHERLQGLVEHFETQGGRTLLFGKFTHSAGAAVLVAAGLARMPFFRFAWINMAASIPKSLFFVALGYWMGSAYSRIDNWISRITLVLAGLIVLTLVLWILNRIARK